MSTFKLIVKGELLAGHQPDDVRAAVAQLFNLPPEAEEMDKILSGRPVVLKRGLEQAQADKYQAMIRAAGLDCHIVAEQQPAAEETAAAAPQADEPESQPDEPMAESAPRAEESGADADYNPYQQPEADLEVAGEPGDFALVDPQKLSAGSGWGWLREGYYYFKQNPGLWVGAVVIVWVITVVLSIIPLVSILVNLIMPVFTGGFMLACYKQFQGEGFSMGDVFAGFKTNLGGLLAVGGLYLLGIIVLMAIAMGLMFTVVGGPAAITAMGEQAAPPANPLLMVLVGLVMFALMIPLMMAYWFAPALVMLNELSAVQAMRLSLKGCLRNWLPFLLYGVVGLVLAIVATIPLALGWLVLGPVMMGSMFAAYRQIYTNTTLEP